MEFIKNRLFKQIVVLIIVFLFLFLFSSRVNAKTLNQIKSELSAMKSKYETTKNQKSLTEAQKKEVEANIESINADIKKTQGEIKDLNDDIDARNAEIDKMQKEIKNITHYYQVSSSESMYLEYVFNASNFTDFIYRLSVSEQLSEYRKKTINTYQALVEENKAKVSELSEKQVSLENSQEQLNAEAAKLGEQITEYTDGMIDIEDEIKDLQDMINLYETKYKCSGNEDVSSCVNRYNNARAAASRNSSGGSSSSVTAYGSLPSAAGFYRPTATGRMGSVFGLSAWYFNYSVFHYGIDIELSHGTPVYSIADGIVVKTNYRSSCGGNMVFIAHKVNGNSYTSGYFHLSSYNVSVGQTVTKDTLIGYSGGVGSIEYWDGCSTGGHLHLQTATGVYMTDYYTFGVFQSRSFNPTTIVNMPAFHEYFSGR